MSADINDYALMPLKVVKSALADFDCGREDIDDFFHNKAQAYEKAMFGKTYAFCPNGNPDIIMGAITVANASIFTRHLSWRRRDFIGADVEDEKSGQNYPAVLLGRLGVDCRYQHLHRNINDREGEPPIKLETRLMFFDLINYNIEN